MESNLHLCNFYLSALVLPTEMPQNKSVIPIPEKKSIVTDDTSVIARSYREQEDVTIKGIAQGSLGRMMKLFYILMVVVTQIYI